MNDEARMCGCDRIRHLDFGLTPTDRGTVQVLQMNSRHRRTFCDILRATGEMRLVVCMVEPKDEFVLIYTPDAAPQRFSGDDLVKTAERAARILRSSVRVF